MQLDVVMMMGHKLLLLQIVGTECRFLPQVRRNIQTDVVKRLPVMKIGGQKTFIEIYSCDKEII